MATPQSQQETKLEIKHTCSASRERVFRAWTDPAELARWFHPSVDHSTLVPELDLRVGGAYRLEMHHKTGTIHRLYGTYREINPPEKLVFSWRWQPDGPESLVTLEFRDLSTTTEIHLTHEHLPSIEERDKHNHGWLGCLDQLNKYLP